MNRKIDIAIYAVLILAIIITLGFIFGNSLKGPTESGAQSDAVVEMVKPIIDPDDHMSKDDISHLVRKSAHFIEYFILGIECALLAYYAKRKFTIPFAIYGAAFCLLVADIDEYIQSFTDRGSSVSDVLLDLCGSVVGIAIGFALSYLIHALVKKAKKAKKENE